MWLFLRQQSRLHDRGPGHASQGAVLIAPAGLRGHPLASPANKKNAMSCYCPSKQTDDGTGVSLAPNYIIAAAFGQCAYAASEVASVVIGWLSIACWVVATYPQMRMSFLLKRCEAISVAFLALWFVGDILNLASLVVIKGLLTQIILGSIWLAMDIVLNWQYIYYHRRNGRRGLSDQGIEAATHCRAPEVVLYTVIAASVVAGFLCYAVPAGAYMRAVAALGRHDGLASCDDTATAQYPEPRWWAGTVMAYCTIPLYCLTAFQAVKSVEKKEVEDPARVLLHAREPPEAI